MIILLSFIFQQNAVFPWIFGIVGGGLFSIIGTVV